MIKQRIKNEFLKLNSGFTLIEVLIAIVVLSLGLLGLGTLQITALNANQSAYRRSQAIELAYELSDRMRVNQVEAGKLQTSTYMTFIPTAPFQLTFPCQQSPGCLPAVLAQYDLTEWYQSVAANLPGCAILPAQSCYQLRVIDTNALAFSLTIAWDDNNDSVIDTKDRSVQINFSL